MNLDPVLVSGILAAIISVAFSLLFRYADQPKPSWALVQRAANWSITPEELEHGYNNGPTYSFMLSNVGSGPARQLSVIGIGMNGEPHAYRTEPKANKYFPLVEAGDQLEVIANPLVSDWPNNYILITWEERCILWPRNRPRHCTFRLSDYFPAPKNIRKIDYLPGQTVAEQHDHQLLEKWNEDLYAEETHLKKSGKVQQVSSNIIRRYFQFRRIRKKGWTWSNTLET